MMCKSIPFSEADRIWHKMNPALYLQNSHVKKSFTPFVKKQQQQRNPLLLQNLHEAHATFIKSSLWIYAVTTMLVAKLFFTCEIP